MVSKIKALAKSRGLSIMQVEEQCGFGKKSIYDWDAHRPNVDKVKRVADFFGVSMDELLEPETQN